MNSINLRYIEMVLWVITMMTVSYRASIASIETHNPFFVLVSILSGVMGFVLLITYIIKRFG